MIVHEAEVLLVGVCRYEEDSYENLAVTANDVAAMNRMLTKLSYSSS